MQQILEQFILNKTLQPYPIFQYAFIKTEQIDFTQHVRDACKANMCGRYGKCWTCPPGAGELDVLREHFKSYKNALVYTTKHELEDSFDVEGMAEGRKMHDLLDEALLKHLSDLNRPYELAGAGSCSVCEKCTYPDAPCRHPKRARRSMEACGIDVVALARECKIHYMNGENTVTYFSILFY